MDNHDSNKSEINLYPIVDDSGKVKYVSEAEYQEYCTSHYIKHINNEDTNSMDKKMNYDNLDEFKEYIQRKVDDIESKQSDIHEDFQYENYDDFIKSVQEEVRGIFEEEDKKVQDDPYISGTHILKPRDREVEETDQEYVDYLHDYYQLMYGKKHKVKSHKKYFKTKLLKIILTICTFATVTLYGLFGFGGKKQKDVNSNFNIHKTVESVNDDMTGFTDNLDRDVEKEIQKMMNHKKYKKATTSKVGDVVQLRNNTTYYYDAQMSKPTGKIGNLYSPKNGHYIVDGIALVHKKNNKIIVTGYEAGLSAKEMMQMYGLEKDDCRVMYHISVNHDKLQLNSNKASQRGWVKFEKNNYRLKKNITKQSKSYVKRKAR